MTGIVGGGALKAWIYCNRGLTVILQLLMGSRFQCDLVDETCAEAAGHRITRSPSG
jgi:hypothetical protein